MYNYDISRYYDCSRKEASLTGIYTINFVEKPNKFYVGSASKFKGNKTNDIGFYARWREHLYLLRRNKHHSNKLQNAFNKYGENSIRFKILDFCDYTIILDIEQYWINILDSYRSGYNCYPYTNKSRNKIILSEKHRRNLSERMKGNGNAMIKFLSNLTDEEKHQFYLDTAYVVPVYEYDIKTKKVYYWDSIKNASDYYNIYGANICRVCREMEITYKNKIWIYKSNFTPEKMLQLIVKYFDNKIKSKVLLKNNRFIPKISVVQKTLDGQFICKWDSIKLAADKLGLDSSGISKACSGVYKKCGKFKWEYCS